MFKRPRTPDPRDEGLEQINDLERQIVLAREQTWTWNGVSPEEIARYLPDVARVAKNVCDQLRAEYLARRP
jgi:hypothetical protein